MDERPSITTPGTGLPVTEGGVPQPAEVPHVDDATVALIAASMLIGGEPGSGKTGLRPLLTVREAPSASADQHLADRQNEEG
jgi:hypothetical protein